MQITKVTIGDPARDQGRILFPQVQFQTDYSGAPLLKSFCGKWTNRHFTILGMSLRRLLGILSERVDPEKAREHLRNALDQLSLRYDRIVEIRIITGEEIPLDIPGIITCPKAEITIIGKERTVTLIVGGIKGENAKKQTIFKPFFPENLLTAISRQLFQLYEFDEVWGKAQENIV